MNKLTDKQRIATLEREIEKLKAAQAPPPASTFKPMSDAEWRDMMHQAAERRANSWQPSGEVLRKMVDACGTADLRDLVHASHRPQGPSTGGIPSSQTLTGVHPGGGARIPPGGGTGWARQREWGADGQHPTPGVAQADRIAEAFAQRDRAELSERLGKK